MINTFVCVHSLSLIKEIIVQLNGSDGVEMIGLSTTLPGNPQAFYTMDVDVLVLDCTTHIEEAFALSEQIHEDEHLTMRIIYLFQQLQDQDYAALLKIEEKPVCIQAPFTIGKLMQAITQQGSISIESEAVHSSELGFASKVMQNMGLPVHLKGFSYIKSAVLILYKCNDHTQYPMKQVYKEVARVHGTTVSRVEKAIRTSIDYAFRVAPERIAVHHKKPTNSQLIHLVCERILLHEIEKKGEEMA